MSSPFVVLAKKSPARAPNRSSIPPFPRFPSLYGGRRAARPAEVLRTKPSIKPNRKGTPKACLFAFPDAFRQRRNRQGQVCRSRPHKIPHKSQGVYLTFIPLLAPRRRDLVRRADERGISGKVSLGTFPVSKGDSVPLRRRFSPAARSYPVRKGRGNADGTRSDPPALRCWRPRGSCPCRAPSQSSR